MELSDCTDSIHVRIEEYDECFRTLCNFQNWFHARENRQRNWYLASNHIDVSSREQRLSYFKNINGIQPTI